MRGLAQSVGPIDGEDALGGNVLVAAKAQLAFTLPHPIFDAFHVRGHLFANCSNILRRIDSIRNPYAGILQPLHNDMRVTAGFGIAFPLSDQVRVEFNYVHPLRTQPHDAFKPFHWGIGMDFI